MQRKGFASVRLAQTALESAWGEATPKDIDTGRESFNLTGVKGRGPAGSVRCWTWEVVNGRDVKVIAEFRAYDSFEEHIAERDKIFDWNNYDGYRAATTWQDACDALQSAPMPYATDPSYASKLKAIIEANNFDRFDSYVFVDVPGDAPFADELRELKAAGIVNGQNDGRLNLSEESVRTIIICRRMIDAAKGAK